MIPRSFLARAALMLCAALVPISVFAQRQPEALGRAVVALRGVDTGGNGTSNWSGSGMNQIYVGWRLLATDPEGIAFNVYRSAGGGAAVKLNSSPITTSTNYVDTTATLTVDNAYSVKPVINGVEGASSESWTLPANSAAQPCFTIPMPAIADGTYYVHLAWVGDLDGDGYPDIVVDRLPTTGTTIKLEAYSTRTRTRLWSVDYGSRGTGIISAGQNDGVTVFDFNGDGKCEVVTKSIAGTIFGDGAVLPGTTTTVYMSVLEGSTGRELSRYQIATAIGASTDAKNIGVAFLDGIRPSLVIMDEAHDFNAFDIDPSTFSLSARWKLDSPASPYPHGHGFRIGDIDGDGRDEINDIGMAVDDNGTLLFQNELNHGDRFHVADIDPDRPGLECFAVQQDNPTQLNYVLYDAQTGSMLWRRYASTMVDNGRGNIGSIDSRYTGQQSWSAASSQLVDQSGNTISNTQPGNCNFSIWWDDDLLRETLNRQLVDKWNSSGTAGGTSRLLTGYNFNGATYSWRDAVPFYGDILGDWREEIITESGDDANLVIFSTTKVASSRTYTLLQDPRYRADLTLKGYMQSHHPGFYFGQSMPRAPRAPFWNGDLTWVGSAGSNVWDKSSARWKASAAGNATEIFTDGDSVLFDLSGESSSAVTLAQNLAPSRVVVHTARGQAYTFSGAGALTGAMTLTKGGEGTLTLSGNHSFTGATVVSEGSLIVNGQFTGSAVRVDSRGLLGGTGVISKAVDLSEPRATLAPGGTGAAGTLTLSAGLTVANGAVAKFDLAASPSGSNDRVAVTGNLTFTGSPVIEINTIAGSLSPGTYTLFTYTGTFSGSVASVVIRGADAYPCTLANTGSAITLTVASQRTTGSLIWAGGTSGAWTLATGTGWTNGGSATSFVTGDAVRFDDTGSSQTNVTLTATRYPASTTIDSTLDYSFSGSGGIGGSGGLTKTGTGTLNIATSNTYTGPTTINGGVLAVTSLADGGLPSSIGASDNSASNLVLNNGTLRLSGGSSSTFRSMTVNSGGGTIDLPSSATVLNISGVITGSGKLTKSGPGRLIVNAVNTYTGGTVIQEGTLVLTGSREDNSPTSAIRYGLGTGSVTLAGGTLSLADTSTSDFDYVSSQAAWPIIVPAGSAGRLDANGRMTLSSTLTGGGDFTFFTPYVRTDVTGNWSAFTGKINVLTDGDGGDFRIANSAGFANAWINLAANVYVYSRAGSGTTTIAIGALSGADGAVINAGGGSGLGANQPAHWRIGARNLDTTFAGKITGTSLVTKVGSGALTLTGANTYTGATSVTAGRLVLAGGSLSGSAVTVSSGAGFGGNGSVTGNVTFNSGASLLLNPAAPLAVTGNVTLGSTLTVAAAPGATLAAGTYTLLTASGTLSGSPAITWASPGFSATFNTSVAGQISITLVKTTQPPTDLVAAPGDARATLTWTPAASAVSYSVLRSTVSGGPYDTIATGLTGTSYSDTTVTNGRTYFYVVSAIAAGGVVDNSAQAAVSIGPSNPYAHWRLDETSGTIASDFSGNGRNGTLVNTPAWTAGRINNGLSLASASSQHVTLPSGVVASLNDFTIATWVRMTTLANWARIFDFGTGTSNYMFLAPGTSSSNLPRFAIRTSSVAEQIIDSSVAVTAGSWVHVAVTLSGSTGTLYLNGTAVGTNTGMTLSPSSLGSTTLNYLGRSQFSTDPYLNGALDDFRVYGRALTATEIAALAAPPVAPTGLAATIGSTSIALTWNAVSDATTYAIYRATVNGGPYTSVAAGIGGTSFQDGGLQPNTTYFYAVTASKGLSEGPRSTQLTAKTSTLVEGWRKTWFGTSTATGTAANTADPDGDGLVNLMEYALGGNPLVASTAVAPVLALHTDHLDLTFTRVADPNLTYSVEASAEPGGTSGAIWTSTGTSNIAGSVTVHDSVTVTTTGRRFLRLRVTY